jgi:hypothetical protein
VVDMLDPKILKDRLFNSVFIESETHEEATELYRQSKLKLALSRSTISSVVMGLCHQVFTRDPQFETYAVQLAGDGIPLLTINPDFQKMIGPEQGLFALMHEAMHLMLRHLYTDPSLRENPNWITATEACINWRITRHYGVPLIKDPATGEVLIVDPDKVYDQYRDGCKKAGIQHVSKEEFYSTDLTCLRELDRLPKPPKPKSVVICIHGKPSDGDGDGDGQGSGGAPMDDEEVQKFMDRVLAGTIQAAKAGNESARDEVLRWMDSSPEAAKAWGSLGAGALRGQTLTTKAPSQWEKWTADIVGSKVEDANRWKYNKKLSAIDPRVSARGKQPRRHGSVFVDASGSMHQDVLDRVAAIIGDIDEIDVDWHSFDGAVWPFKTGEAFQGGGGTSFQVIDDHVREGGDSFEDDCEADPDFVLVITDGYAPHIIPRDAESWIWLIVPGGDAWPSEAGMSCRHIELDELEA